jgi:hypothetical protein
MTLTGYEECQRIRWHYMESAGQLPRDWLSSSGGVEAASSNKRLFGSLKCPFSIASKPLNREKYVQIKAQAQPRRACTLFESRGIVSIDHLDGVLLLQSFCGPMSPNSMVYVGLFVSLTPKSEVFVERNHYQT